MLRFISFIKYVMIVLLAVVLAYLVFLIIGVRSNPEKIKSVLGYIPMTVASGSMSPNLNAGDLIIVKETKPEKINYNDIISFKFEDNRIITHRAIEVFKNSNEVKIQTKGDANDDVDDWDVSNKNLIGVVCFKIPLGGYFVKCMASWKGIVIMMVIPIFFIISGELKQVLCNIPIQELNK
ncbi:MAG: signal peptidase I [Deltaproteobacteria bacterium]